MNISLPKSFYAGLGVYGVCILLAALPIFTDSMNLVGLVELCIAACVASLLVALARYAELFQLIRDPRGVFTQALLGIGICSGLYSVVCDGSRPEIMFLAFLLWTAVGLLYLTPVRVAILYFMSLGISLNAFVANQSLFNDGAQHAEAIYMLLVSAVMGGFMCCRARDYTRLREDRTRLRQENAIQSTQLEEAEQRIHAITVRDMDTIALKYPYFRSSLVREKTRADSEGGTFSIGLVGIDHFEEFRAHHGEAVSKQLLREFAERTTKLVKAMGFVPDEREYHPLGRVGDGLFGLVLPGVGLKGAEHCVQRLNKAAEFRAIPTAVGPVTVTFAIGMIEYRHGEDIDELLGELSHALERARLSHEELQPKALPKPRQAPLRAATAAHELMLIDYKDYGRPVH